MRNYEEAFDIIVNMAKVKMTMNNHKGLIENLSHDEIIILIRGEVEELSDALKNENTIRIIEEAGDVLNFAVAAVQQQLTKYRSRK